MGITKYCFINRWETGANEIIRPYREWQSLIHVNSHLCFHRVDLGTNTNEKLESMKKIEAIIRVTQFEEVRDALAEIGVQFFTLKEVRGYGLQKGRVMTYRGANHGADYIARLQMDIMAIDSKVDSIVETIEKSGRTGSVGDGKIIVFDIDTCVRIRTGERNENAV